ncbi:MAG TPA: glycosyltransferase family 9 protein [Bacteroidia bacterium]|nr:glycosyltransferase family 9 protein [Bacteroidia bacterium]
MKKILIVRFSSIGDIVLTTPVIRCCKLQLEQTEIHFVCKESFRDLLEHNPYISKLHCFKTDIGEILPALKAEKYDLMIDLHRNLRSLRLKTLLRVKSISFNKLNLRKLAAVNFKQVSLLPAVHIVDRYLDTCKSLGVHNDGKGLDYFISEQDKALPQGRSLPPRFIALVIGGSYFTKKIPLHKLLEIADKSTLPLVLLGGREDKDIADQIGIKFPGVLNLCATLSLNQSAYVVSLAEWVITSDTGMMHIAAAYKKKIISVWGNTIPEFGMGPYLPTKENRILEIRGLPCRPCSKLGFGKCPKGHFKCMNQIDFTFLRELH